MSATVVWWTAEDEAPRDRVERYLAADAQSVAVVLPVRHPRTRALMRVPLVIRAQQATGDVTAAVTSRHEGATHGDVQQV